MNTSIFKMIEQLGYRIDYNKLKIYDKEGVELIEKRVCDEVHNGIEYIGKNGELFRFDESGYAEIIIDSDTNITIHNLYNEYDSNSISIYLGPINSNSELTINFDIFKNTKVGGNNSVFVSAYENTVFSENDDYFAKELSIIENEDGADIYLFNKIIKHLDLDNCTKDNYLNIITRFINHIENKKIRKDIKRCFDIIKPVFLPMVDNIINNRELIENKVKKKQ